MAIISSYFDFDDYENPIHYYLQDLNIMPMIPSLSQRLQYQVRLNKASMSDSLLFGSQGDYNQLEFYSIERKQNFYASIDFDNSFLRVYISLDPEIDLYSRTVYSFLDMLGFVGGIFELFKLAGHVISCIFIQKIFYYRVISKISDTLNKKKCNDSVLNIVHKENKEDSKNEAVNINEHHNKGRKIYPVSYVINDPSVSSIENNSNWDEENKSNIEDNSNVFNLQDLQQEEDKENK